MENKHYTPSIDEFRVGFDYEELHMVGTYEHWIKERFSLNTADENSLRKIQTLIDNEQIRVKHLDQDDIESLGFFRVVEGIMVRDVMQEFCKDLGRLYVHLTYTKFSDHASIRIECSVSEDSERTLVVHSIKIRNKSELKVLLNQLNIK